MLLKIKHINILTFIGDIIFLFIEKPHYPRYDENDLDSVKGLFGKNTLLFTCSIT